MKKNYKKTILKNGLRIITIPEKETQAATVLVLVATGSKYETKDISGISHFLEHMLFKGTEKSKTPMDVAEVLDKIGGDYNAFTGEEYTGYYAKVDASHFDQALGWVSDIFLNSKLPAKEMEKERGVIIEEIKMYEDNPMRHIEQVWKELLYGDQPAGWDIAGTRETIKKMQRTDILKYINSQYVAKNTVICVAGNIKEKIVIEKIKKQFARIQTSEFKPKPKVAESQKEPQIKLSYKDIGQTHIALGVRAYNMFHSERFALQLLAVILGGMMSSRMFDQIREKLGAAYYVRTYYDSDTDTGYLATFAGVDNAKLEKVIEAVLKEYKKIKDKKVGADELKKAKDYIKGKTVLGLESSDALASFYGSQELLRKEILTPEQIFKEIDKVTATDIQKIAKDIFTPEKLNLAIISKLKDEKQFKKLLKI
ncbi:MAG: pitrilysin family protein [Candidatus Paceibacterota bacterium]